MTKFNITVINTGGTFNKIYNPLNGDLDVAKDTKALKEILSFCYNLDCEVNNIISKDSLELNDNDRLLIVKTINETQNENIIIIHGTDTMNLSALFVDNLVKDKKIIFLGSMLPFSINKVEATLNFAMAIGFLNSSVENGVYISMHGSVKNYKYIKKNRKIGQFLNC